MNRVTTLRANGFESARGVTKNAPEVAGPPKPVFGHGCRGCRNRFAGVREVGR